MDKSSAWWIGYNAYLSDIPRDENPFFTNRREREDWEDGWDAASSDN